MIPWLIVVTEVDPLRDHETGETDHDHQERKRRKIKGEVVPEVIALLQSESLAKSTRKKRKRKVRKRDILLHLIQNQMPRLIHQWNYWRN